MNMEWEGPSAIPTRRSLKPVTLPTMKNDHLTACACLISSVAAWALLHYFEFSSPLKGIVFFFVVMVVTFAMNLKTKPYEEQQINRIGGYEINLNLYNRMPRKINKLNDPRTIAESLGLTNEYMELPQDIKLQDPWNESSTK